MRKCVVNMIMEIKFRIRRYSHVFNRVGMVYGGLRGYYRDMSAESSDSRSREDGRC